MGSLRSINRHRLGCHSSYHNDWMVHQLTQQQESLNGHRETLRSTSYGFQQSAQSTTRDSLLSLREQVKSSTATANALQEQVKQLEKANHIAMAANPPEKAPWGDAKWTGRGALFRIHNEGKRNAIVTAVRATEPNLQNLLRFSEPTPFTSEPGDSIDYMAIGTSQTGTPKTEIEWHWEDDDTVRTTHRSNIKPKL
jgi:hypothetical protein